MCRLAAQRRTDDSGAVIIVMTIVVAAGIIFTLLALVIDVGGMFSERRQLQNGADSAAVALAQRCAFDEAECSSDAEAAELASANAVDSAASLAEVCGHAAAYWPRAQRLAVCGQSTSPVVNDCQVVDPVAYPSYVRVRTTTLTASGDDSFPSIFGGLFSGTQQELSSGACAQAAWGVPASAKVALPFLLPICPGNVTSGPFELLDFYSNDPTQTCGEFEGVTKGWALGDLYGDGYTCDTGVSVSVGDTIAVLPPTTHMCGDPNTLDDVATVLARHINLPRIVPVVGIATCADKDKDGNPKKNCGLGSYEFVVVGFKSFTILGFKLHNAVGYGAAPAGGWNPDCSKSRDCLLGSVGTDVAQGTIDPSNPTPDLDFGVRVIEPLP